MVGPPPIKVDSDLLHSRAGVAAYGCGHRLDAGIAKHNSITQDNAIAEDYSERVIRLVLRDQACAGSVLMFEKDTFRPVKRLSRDGRLRGRWIAGCQHRTAVRSGRRQILPDVFR